MEYAKAVLDLLDQQQVVLDDTGDGGYWKRIVFSGRRAVWFFSPRNEKLTYWVEPVNKKGRVLIRIQLQEVGTTIAEHKGDIQSMGTRKRFVREVTKRWLIGWRVEEVPITHKDWKIPEIVATELERLAWEVPKINQEWERIMVFHIKIGKDAALKEKLLNVLQQPQPFPTETEELLAALERLPVEVIDGEPMATFTRQDLAGRMGISIDAVRNRLSPLEGQPFLRIKQRGKGNQPTIYCYLPGKRATGAKVQREATIGSDTEIVAPTKPTTSTHPLRYESKGLVRYGEKEGSY